MLVQLESRGPILRLGYNYQPQLKVGVTLCPKIQDSTMKLSYVPEVTSSLGRK